MTHAIGDFVHAYQEEGKIIGVECEGCKFKTATTVQCCPRCGGRTLKEVSFPTKGKVVSFTLQYVPSDEFINDSPYVYALVELEDGTRVSGWLPEVKTVEDLNIGDPVQWKPSYKPGMVFEKVGGSP